MVVMRKLQLKLFRDIGAAKAQFGAVTLIILLGVSIFIGSYAAYQNLDTSYNYTYDHLHMADYWISVDSIPQRAMKEMGEIPGVVAQGRIIGDVSLDLGRESGERVVMRVVSLPLQGHPEINDVQVESGSYFGLNSRREILLEKSFADYHKFKPGDWLTITKEDSTTRFKVAGIVTSPEYIWVSKSAQELMVTPRTFGIVFVPQPRAESLFGMKGLFNDINLIVEQNVDRAKVIDEVKHILERHGIKRLTSKDESVDISTRKRDIAKGVRIAYMVERKDQLSNRLLQEDIEGFRQIAFLFPMLFLSMASFTIYVILNRLVESQRVQIGLMRGLGYGKAAVVLHYLGFALIVGVAGSLLGAGLGYVLANVLTVQYISFLNVPSAVVKPHWDVMAVGMVIGIVIPLVSGLLPAWATARIRPAEAMRPAKPAAGHRTVLETLLPFLRRLPYVLKLPLRNIFRNQRRSFFMAMGVASATMLVLVSMSFVDLMESMMYIQYQQIQTFDARIILQGIGSEATASRLSHLDGIQHAEAVLEMPYRLQHNGLVSDSGIMGLPQQSSMYHLFTPEGEPTTVIEDGILLPLSLKEKLGVEVGDKIQMEPLVGTIGETEKRLSGFVNEPLGGRVFMPLEEAQELLRAPRSATGVLLRFDGEPSADLLEKLYDLPQTASIEFASDTRQYFDEMMGFFWVFIGVMLAMGAALGLAIIFNGVTVNVLERTREIAIMRAVGTSYTRLALMLTVENLAIGCLGVIIGMVLGYYISVGFMSQVEADIFNMSVVIFPRSYVIAAVGALVILLVSQIPAIRQIYRLSLPTATKDWSE